MRQPVRFQPVFSRAAAIAFFSASNLTLWTRDLSESGPVEATRDWINDGNWTPFEARE